MSCYTLNTREDDFISIACTQFTAPHILHNMFSKKNCEECTLELLTTGLLDYFNDDYLQKFKKKTHNTNKHDNSLAERRNKGWCRPNIETVPDFGVSYVNKGSTYFKSFSGNANVNHVC